jgi:acyl-CoA thioesterase
LLDTVQLEPGAASIVVTDDWLQGRSVFGGLQVAVAVLAMRTLVPASVPLRTVQVCFTAPVPGGRMHARACVLRVGKSATQVEAQLMNGEEVLATVLAVFGTARASVIGRMPSMPAVDTHAPVLLPAVDAGPAPSFTQHFRAAWVRGSVPFSGDPLPECVVELDFIDRGPMSESHLLAIADFIPPVALSMLPRPTPGASMTWMLELVRESYEGLPLTGWRIDAEMLAAFSGYTSQSTMVYAPDGGLAAISRQSMVVFG